ncbi:MAG: hypothetical protein V4534_03280 [Myxococcota bacterium]
MKIEIYASAGAIEGQRIVSFLESAGIETSLVERDVFPQMPTTHQFIIAVAPDFREKAIEIIANARLDQVITDTGTFL